MSQVSQPLSHPPMLDLTMDSITENVMQINSMCDNPRLRCLITELSSSRKTTFAMWVYSSMSGSRRGNTSLFVLLFDIFGISALVDAISYPASSGATETSVLGPFHDEEAHSFEYGDSITTKGTPGEPTIVHGFIRDTDGKAVPEALIDVWETDGNGIYDLGYEGSQDPNYHGKIFTNSNGHYFFKCVKLVVSYFE